MEKCDGESERQRYIMLSALYNSIKELIQRSPIPKKDQYGIWDHQGIQRRICGHLDPPEGQPLTGGPVQETCHLKLEVLLGNDGL